MKLRYVLPATVAAAGIVVAQLHGGPFWVELLDSQGLGWTVSFTWEAASVWLWWRGDTKALRWLAKWGATAVLMLGMVAQGAGPLLLQQERATAAGDKLASALAGERETLAGLMEATVQQERRGWKGSIDATQKRIAELEDRELALIVSTDAALSLPPWAVVGIAWGTVGIFPLLYGLALLAISTVAEEIRKNSEPIRVVPKLPPNLTARELGTRYGRAHELPTWIKVAEKIGEAPSTLSEFLNGKTGLEVTARIRKKLGS